METFLSQVSLISEFTYGIVELEPIYYELPKNEVAFLKKFLTPLERQTFKKFSVLKRKAEWLGGRLAAKQAFRKYQGRYEGNDQLNVINIFNDSNRAPYIDGYTGLNLSISHAGDYAVAVLGRFPIGVDIERVTVRPQMFSNYFLCHEEQQVIQKVADQPEKIADLLTYFWTRKEAVSKVLQKGGSLNFKTINTCQDVVIINSKIINSDIMAHSAMNDSGIQLFSGCYGQYYLSLAINT